MFKNKYQHTFFARPLPPCGAVRRALPEIVYIAETVHLDLFKWGDLSRRRPLPLSSPANHLHCHSRSGKMMAQSCCSTGTCIHVAFYSRPTHLVAAAPAEISTMTRIIPVEKEHFKQHSVVKSVGFFCFCFGFVISQIMIENDDNASVLFWPAITLKSGDDHVHIHLDEGLVS